VTPRVLVVTPDFPPARGGIQHLVHRVVSHLRRFDVRVITLGDGDACREVDAGLPFPVERIAPGRGPRQVTIARLNAAAVAAARTWRPDVVLNCHIVLSPGTAVIRRLWRIPVVQYVYAKEIGARPAVARHAMHHADRIIAISGYAEELALGVGAQASRIRRITPGVDLPAPERVASIDEHAREPTILTIARLEDRYKGQDVVIRALTLVRQDVPEARYVVIGDGPLRPQLERLAAAHGVAEAVSFLGAVSDEERDEQLRRASVFTMPSRLPAGGFAGEGFGIVYLEAGAFRVPVVAGNVAGALDAVVHGETGLLVDPADPIAVADALSTLLRDRGLARTMGRDGEQFARSFAWPYIAEELEDVLLEVVA
jgi:phosphatidyl-myo-inositol dimannoside synthase